MIAKLVLATGAWSLPDILPAVPAFSAGTRSTLMALLGLLVVILGGLVAVALVIRRRPGVEPSAREPREDAEAAAPETPAQDGEPARAVEDPMACPACRRELAPGLRFCPHDATRLVPAPAMLDLAATRQRRTLVCPRCRRAYQGKVAFCPHDGSDLVPLALHRAMNAMHEHGHDHDHDHDHGHDHGAAKICPECQDRYEYAATFCGRDGMELVLLN